MTAGVKRLLRTEVGFDPGKLVVVDVQVNNAARITPERLFQEYKVITSEVLALPFVKDASVSGCGLLTGCVGMTPVIVPGSLAKAPYIQRNYVGPDYGAALGFTLLSGRMFDRRENQAGACSIMVNDSFRQKFSDADVHPGTTVIIEGRQCAIVGIIKDARLNNVHTTAEAELFGSIYQMPGWSISQIVARVDKDPAAVRDTIAAKLHQSTVPLTVGLASTGSQLVLTNLVEELLISRLAALFGVCGISMAAVAVSLILSFRLQLREGEIGVRVALGASRTAIYSLAIKEIAIPLCTGIIAGLMLAALAINKSGVGFLEEGGDTYVYSGVLIATVALIAGIIPVARILGMPLSRLLRST